jgi:hypothetical protein
MLPGGLMIEGTANPFGSIWVANLARRAMESDSFLSKIGDWRIRRSAWRFESLVFSTNFRLGFDITDFQAVLPKNYIHHVVPGSRFMSSSKTGSNPWQRLPP